MRRSWQPGPKHEAAPTQKEPPQRWRAAEADTGRFNVLSIAQKGTKVKCGKLAALALAGVMLAAPGIAERYECKVHKGEWVWIRETPEPTGRKIGRVRYGYEVDADEPVNGFLEIQTKAGWMLEGEHAARGYVDASYFDRPITETMYRVNTQGGPLAKRETPGGRLLCWIKPGVKISVLGWRYDKDGALWAAVYKGGYVKAEYLAEL